MSQRARRKFSASEPISGKLFINSRPPSLPNACLCPLSRRMSLLLPCLPILPPPNCWAYRAAPEPRVANRSPNPSQRHDRPEVDVTLFEDRVYDASDLRMVAPIKGDQGEDLLGHLLREGEGPPGAPRATPPRAQASEPQESVGFSARSSDRSQQGEGGRPPSTIPESSGPPSLACLPRTPP